jgi:hypothetical protein
LLDEPVIQQIGTVHEGIRRIGQSFPQVRRAIARYYNLDFVGERAPARSLYVLGLFSVIESLLTHEPSGEHDSLGHQIRTKMLLLNRRFNTPLDFSVFGAGAVPATVWSKLYAFRSIIAHGKEPDFSSKLQLLKDARTATAFLDSAAKALLRQGLVEPELILDLQDC